MHDGRDRVACKGKAALITGGDSGIGRAVAILFAREGADVALSYLNEHGDAEETKRLVEAEGRRCLTHPATLAMRDSASSWCSAPSRSSASSTYW